jgi:hypothetical protein
MPAGLDTSEVAIVERLFVECLADANAQARNDTFYPDLATCQVCHGYPLKDQRGCDVHAQLGVCGCLIAIEMELEEREKAESRKPASDVGLRGGMVMSTAAAQEICELLIAETLGRMDSARADKASKCAEKAPHHLLQRRAKREIAFRHAKRPDRSLRRSRLR